MRPASELLETISKLAELDPVVRKGAVRELVKTQENLLDEEINQYLLERLVSGCASARAAVRIGYTTALGTLLPTDVGKSWGLDRILAIADKKMDLAEKTVGSSHAIGHFLVLVAFSQAKAKKLAEPEILKLVEHSLKIREVASGLAFSQTNFLVNLAGKVKESMFAKTLSPTIEAQLEQLSTQFTPETIFLALSLRKSHSGLVAKHAKFVKKDGSCQFSDEQFPKILAALKRCDYGTLQALLPLLMKVESNSFEKMYLQVLEPWALSSNETKVFDRILLIVNQFFEHGGDSKSIVVIFTKEVLNRMETATRGKKQFRLMSKKVEEFANFIKTKLGELRDEEAYCTLKDLQSRGNVDKACGTGITTALLSNLGKKQVSKWIKENQSNQDEVRKIVSAFSHWDEKSRITVLSTLLAQKATETSQAVVTSIIDSLFYVKTRAGEFACLQISEKNEQVLRELVVAVEGEEAVKKAEKTIGKAKLRKKSLQILYYVSRLWSKIAASPSESASYDADSQEILQIAKNESDENNSLVFVDLLLSVLSKEQKFHRTPVSFAFVHAISTLKNKDLEHVVEAAMMSEAELAGNDDEDMEDEEGMPFDESEIPDRSDEEEDSDDEDEEDEDDDEGNETVDQELLDKLTTALGDAAANESSDAEMDDLDDEAMKKIDERLAAAFKAMGSKIGKDKKRSAKSVEALKMKISDLLLIAISSKDLGEINKIKLIVPLLKWAKIDAKTHDKVAQKALELVNIIVKVKFTGIAEKDALQLLKEVLAEAQTTTNLLIVDAVARVVTFVLKISAHDGKTISAGVRSEFQSLFENYLKNVEGKVPSNFVIQPIADLPTLFVDQLGMLIDAGFDEENRIFRRTEILTATTMIFTKQVLQTATIKSAIVKKIGKCAAAYFQNVIDSDKSELKPRLFGTVLLLILKATTALQDDEKHVATLRDALESVLKQMSEGEVFAQIYKINPVCHHILGKSIPGAFGQIKKSLEIEN